MTRLSEKSDKIYLRGKMGLGFLAKGTLCSMAHLVLTATNTYAKIDLPLA